MFSKAIVRRPCKNMIHGLTGSNLGIPDVDRASQQHDQYVKALETCHLDVTIIGANDDFPDSTFIEDTCLVTPECAIITNPGAISRKNETIEVEQTIRQTGKPIEHIRFSGTLDAGDVMMVGTHFYIGLSKRTNKEGARQLASILETYGMTASTIVLEHVLHLKTGVSYLENNILLAAGEFLNHPAFQSFDILSVDPDESYAANSLWINHMVLVPAGFPKTLEKIKQAGYAVIVLDMSEFQKLDGGLSCLSLRF